MIETNHLKKKCNKVVCKAKYIFFRPMGLSDLVI